MTDILICANAVVFSIFHLLPVAGKIFMEKWIGLSRAGILCGALWQVMTYQFFHEIPFHLLANMLFLWTAGPIHYGEEIRRTAITMGGVFGGSIQLVCVASFRSIDIRNHQRQGVLPS